jgi:hypothetical protein
MLKKVSGIESSTSELLQGLNPKYVVLTSATNFDWDARIGCFCNLSGIKLIAIPRSWDNLTSHGILRYEPDYLLVLSNMMKRHAIENQLIPEHKILVVQNPAYQYFDKKVMLSNALDTIDRVQVLYACSGITIYPKEIEFLTELHQFSFVQKERVEIHVLEHPKFSYDEDTKDSLSNFSWSCFNYIDFDLGASGLFEYLESKHVVLTASSSIALDCLFVGKKSVCIYFDDQSKKWRDYWLSASRFKDSVQHFRELIEGANLQTIFNLQELSVLLEETNSDRLRKDDSYRVEFPRIQQDFGLIGNRISEAINSLTREKSK